MHTRGRLRKSSGSEKPRGRFAQDDNIRVTVVWSIGHLRLERAAIDLPLQLLLALPELFPRLRQSSLSLLQLLFGLVPLPDCLLNLLLGRFDCRDCLFVGLKHE
jgi:hypothetical protein